MKLWHFMVCLIASSLHGASFTNGGFEAGLEGWRFWTRTAHAGSVAVERQSAHGGEQCARIEHTGGQDWSFEPAERLTVQAGEFYDLEVWVRAEGEGSLVLCASTWAEEGTVVDWSYSERSARKTGGWELLRARLFVPNGVSRLQPRIIGNGPIRALVDDFDIRKSVVPGLDRNAGLASVLSLSNKFLELSLNTSNSTLRVRDRRNGRRWQQAAQSDGILLLDGVVRDHRLELKLYHGPSGLQLKGTVELATNAPEFSFTLAGSGEMSSALKFPPPFESSPGEYLVIPMNEGISYPVEDESVSEQRLVAYGGHGICMGFWGVTDGEAGHMAILETPDDAAIQMRRAGHRLVVAPEWEAQREVFGYARTLRYVFFEHGGHVAMAKRYRDYAKQIGLFKTLAEKRQGNPNVDLLVGAVNVWCWDRDAVGIAKELQSAGIEHILWSNAQPPENLRALNELGVLTSRYDIYQDVMDPAQFPKLRWTHPDWTTAAWPKDLALDARGEWVRGWGVEARDGSMIYCGVLCDLRAVDYARARVPAELATHPYKCRFIDTTTASPWRECYARNHPMTRSESKEAKMQLLKYMSDDSKLVTGSETGHEAAVPFVDYFEGMLSLGPYRVPDAGRRMNVIWTNVPEVVAKFQLGQGYRLPLWELVYHDCVVAQWYWGDYNNKLPALWDKRDLFNVLYGTPPMFMFDRSLWSVERERFVQSYKNTCPYVRQSGYSEMVAHRFLTRDRSVQQTEFANGQIVTVNFGRADYTIRGGPKIRAMGFSVSSR